MSSKSQDSKILRKTKRCQHFVKNETGINFVDTPTEFLGVCNAGLSNGLSAEALLEAISQQHNVKDLIMIPNKSYCFIHCPNMSTAEKIYSDFHGKLKLGQNSGVLYFSYFESLPQTTGNGTWHQDLPPGLIILKDFISPDEEKELLKFIYRNRAHTEKGGALKHREVMHFGYEFLYGTNNIDVNKPLAQEIPKECDYLWPRVKDKFVEIDWIKPDQLTVNIYNPGQGIPPHVDTHSAFLDAIISLSLESDIVMEFRQKGGKQVSVDLPRRSLCIMSKESRYGWTHGITPRVMDVIPTESGLSIRHRKRRTSFTFRKLRGGPCNCVFKELCDTQNRSENKTESIDSNVAPLLELQNVHSVYDEIANHFSETRHSPWPKVEEFLQSLPVGSVVLDVGCGNGKYLNSNQNILKIGCDRSEGLLNVCCKKNYNVFKCDCLSLPIVDNSMDGCISIAVIHHLSTKERRLQAISEMSRILTSNGKGLIYVWAKDQEADNRKSSYLRQNKSLRKNDAPKIEETKSPQIDAPLTLPVHTNRTQFQQQDVFVPWKLKSSSNNREFLRYYHVFNENELEQLCEMIPCIEIESSYYDQGNWCIIFRKC